MIWALKDSTLFWRYRWDSSCHGLILDWSVPVHVPQPWLVGGSRDVEVFQPLGWHWPQHHVSLRLRPGRPDSAHWGHHQHRIREYNWGPVRRSSFLLTIQGIATTLGFLLASQLGNPSSETQRRDGLNFLQRSEEEKELSLVEDVLPGLLSRTSSLTQILINGMLVRSKYWRRD